MNLFIFLFFFRNIPLVFIESEFMNYYIFEAFIQKSLLRPGIYKRVGLLLMYYSMKLEVEFVSLFGIQSLPGLFDYRVGLRIVKADVI